jgi:hypothetical protein
VSPCGLSRIVSSSPFFPHCPSPHNLSLSRVGEDTGRAHGAAAAASEFLPSLQPAQPQLRGGRLLGSPDAGELSDARWPAHPRRPPPPLLPGGQRVLGSPGAGASSDVRRPSPPWLPGSWHSCCFAEASSSAPYTLASSPMRGGQRVHKGQRLL